MRTYKCFTFSFNIRLTSCHNKGIWQCQIRLQLQVTGECKRHRTKEGKLVLKCMSWDAGKVSLHYLMTLHYQERLGAAIEKYPRANISFKSGNKKKIDRSVWWESGLILQFRWSISPHYLTRSQCRDFSRDAEREKRRDLVTTLARQFCTHWNSVTPTSSQWWIRQWSL